MIVDKRIYTLKPASVPAYMKIYEEYGLAAQKRHLGEPLLYAITETGEINTYVHVWVYEDAADRARKRAAMEADPDWATYRQKSAEAGYLIRQENKILTPAPFFRKP